MLFRGLTKHIFQHRLFSTGKKYSKTKYVIKFSNSKFTQNYFDLSGGGSTKKSLYNVSDCKKALLTSELSTGHPSLAAMARKILTVSLLEVGLSDGWRYSS